MIGRGVVRLAFVLAVVLVAVAPAPAQEQKVTESLYKRLGGYDTLALVTDEFAGRLTQDPQLGRYFAGHGAASRARMRQLIVDQLCAITGGPCVYIGRDMKSVHAGLGISEREWTVAMAHLVGTLDKLRIAEREKAELVAALTKLKPDIVERP